MISAGLLITIACAFTAAANIKHDLLNNTNIDKRVLRRLTSLLETNKTLDRKDIALLNRTAHSLDLDEKLVTKLMDYVNVNLTDNASVKVDESASSYDNAKQRREDKRESSATIGESPDYASSVVLASDLLSLTSAVAKVKDKVCRAQGYKFLDGLLLNKRWALKSKYNSLHVRKIIMSSIKKKLFSSSIVFFGFLQVI